LGRRLLAFNPFAMSTWPSNWTNATIFSDSIDTSASECARAW
jgi:hypothetical protein